MRPDRERPVAGELEHAVEQRGRRSRAAGRPGARPARPSRRRTGRSRPAPPVPRRRHVPAPGGPPCCSRSSASSESGRTPSAADAAARAARGRRRRRAASRELLSAAVRPARRRRPARGWPARAAARGRVGDLLVELVADVADGADQRLVLGAELGPQPAHVDVDRAGAAEVVVAPDLLQQLRAGEDPARVLGQVLEQLELLVGEVERAAAQLGGVAVLVDDELAGLGDARRRRRRRASRRPAGGRWPTSAGRRPRPGRRCRAGRRRRPSRPTARPARPRRGRRPATAATPVEESRPHSVRAWMRSWRASTRTTSPESPSSRLDSSGATTRTWWAEQPQGGQHLGRGLTRRGHEHESHVVSSRISSTALSR